MKKSFTAKLWQLMRICAVHGMIAITLCGVALAHTNYGQLLDKEISVSLTDISFEMALKEIEAAASVKFAYSIDQLLEEPNVFLSVEERPLGQVLEELLTPRRIRYKTHQKEGVITLTKMPGNNGSDESSGNEGTGTTSRHRPPVQVSGTVKDATTQTPMAGVNVLVKGTTNGTATDADGRYTIEADKSDVLVFSFIGYTSVELPVDDRTVIDVGMTADVLNLTEVVVNAGYWEVSDQERTGNISRLSFEEIEKQPANNPLQALQGRMTGVYIQQNTGMPGGAFEIQVRGQNSLRNGSDGSVNGNLPLYIIDGVPFTSTSLTSPAISGNNLGGGNPLSTINPNDIESIEILKDADATAIYGSRGSNGVVLISTKAARAGKTKVNIDFSKGIGQVAAFMDLLSSEQYLTMRNEAFKNDAGAPTIARAPDLLVWDTTRYTDWQRKLIGGTAQITNAQLSVSGGSEKTQFLFGGGYYRETTVFPDDNSFQRASGRLVVNHHSDDNRLKVGTSVSYSATFSDIPSVDFTGQAISLAPVAPTLYNPDGSLNWQDGTWTNPLSFLENKYKSDIENMVASALVSYELVPRLNIKANLGYTTMNVNEIRTNPLSAYNPQDLDGRTGSSTFGDSRIRTWIIEPQADYNIEMGEGLLTFLLGSTFQQSVQMGSAVEARGYNNDALLENREAATTIRTSENSFTQYRYVAGFARVNYNLKEKYILNLTGRRDGSSRFGPGKRFANYAAAGLAWVFSKEAFSSRNLPFLSFGKLRMSYGTTGSDAIGDYQYLETYSPTPFPYAGSGGLTLTRLANPDYSWETNKKLETGLELGFLKDRVLISASFYLNRSTGQLVGLPLPALTGQSSVQYNLPATVQNKGFEFQLSSTNVSADKFVWTSNFNITLPSNELLEFPDLEKFPAYALRFDVGKPVNIHKKFQYAGVDPLTGLYSFLDLNNDGVVSSPGDYIGIKQVTQEFFGGVGNTFKYGGLSLDVFFQFVKQTGYNYHQSFTIPGLLSNQPSVVMDRWRESNDDKAVQKFTALDPGGKVSSAYYKHISSDDLITDASFVRLKNVSLSWQLPLKWTRPAGIDGTRIYLQGQNLLTFTDYRGLDPETQFSHSLPPLRMITAGIQLTL